MNATDNRARTTARALLADAEVEYPTVYGRTGGTRVDLGDGRTATLRIVFDEDSGIGRWVDGGHHDDVFGTFAWRGRDSCYGYPAERPAGFDGRACVLHGDSRGDRWDGPVWWQPTDDDTDPAATLESVRRWMRGDWFHAGLVVQLDGATGDLASLWGVPYGYGPEVDESHLLETVADLLVEAGLDVDPFAPGDDDDIAPAFARLLVHVAADLAAPNAAADLAELGASGRTLRTVADRWTDAGLEPAEFADRLRTLAACYPNGVTR